MNVARKPTTPKAADPLDILATGVAADHKAKMATATVDTAPPFAEDGPAAVADTVAAGAINGAGAALDAGGDARDVAAATIGGAAAATAEVDDESKREQVRVETERPTKLDTPAAPGDDHETVFDRRLARLTTLVVESEFETGTAFGNLRDCVLDLFKHRPMLWDAMKPSDRRDLIAHVEGICRDIIGKVVVVIAQDEGDSIQGTLDKKWGVNGETIELKVKVDNADGDTLVDALKLAGHKIVIVSADSKRFMSAPRDIDPGEDQLGMPFASDAPVKAAEPVKAPEVSDEALADGDDTGSGVDRAKDAAQLAEGAGNEPEPDSVEETIVDKPFGVFDTTDAEWLASLVVGDASDEWTADTGEALAMTSDEAAKIASEYGDGFEARRFDDEG